MNYEARRAKHLASGQAAAHTAVVRAIRHGELPSLAGQQCADCDEPAIHYDHRDYSRPLEVVPVCRRCNYRRGAAAHVSQSSEPEAQIQKQG